MVKLFFFSFFFTPIKTNIYPIEYSRAKKHVKCEFVSFGDAAGLL